MQVYYNGLWGTVCDNGWDLNDAEVVCTELGYGPTIAAIYPYHVISGNNVGPEGNQFRFDEVNCVGTEVTIANCLHGEWSDHNCIHDEFAGVRCAGSSGTLFNCINLVNFCLFYSCSSNSSC